ncbi:MULTISPECIES: YceI family protein [unclassified Nitrospirillum]|uniref:YceI family protein n=1 Tax=unclassified Nitrospirillum TaxID=2627523 RepID=UPI002ACAA743|nr:YceI family protein [Nitrospirillum sp. BR 11828]MDZ5650434.1 YceI family protein [Nitrospirillum sp. BR 11828]MEE3624589.1 YceI family protein [Nitrospirillum sp. BR 11752]
MKRIPALMLAAALLAAAPATALAQATTDLTKVEGGHFTLDKSHAKVVFAITHFGFSTYYGAFPDLEGTLDFDPKAPAKSKLDVTINVKGLSTANPKLDEHLNSPDFFDTAKFPTATFKATKIEVTGATTGKIIGELTLHGVTKPVTLDASFHGGGTNPMTKAYVVGFDAKAQVKRSEFGVDKYVPYVSDEVELLISGEFDRAQ